MSPRRKLPDRTTPAAAMADPKLLGDAFRGESWARWRAVLRATYAEPLDATELALYREVAEREPPARQVKELWCIVGRRGGKDSIASAVAAVAALGDYRAQLRPGERATVMCLAVDRDQARIIHRYIAGYFKAVPLLSGLVERETDDGLELKNGVEIVIATNSYRAVRGRTIVCVVLDEVAFWRSEESAAPDTETYNALLPAMVTIPGAILIGITTAYRRKGLAFDRWRHAYGKPDDDVLVVLGTSQQFNPLLPAEVIERHLERDPEAAAAEWLSRWRSDLADFLDRELVEGAVDAGVVARPPQPNVAYKAGADPSGGRGSAFTLAISHAEGDAVTLDALLERRAPFEPTATVADAAALLGEYGLTEVIGDRYAASWVTEAFAKEGITYRQSERDRSAVYLDALPLFTAGRARLLDSTPLVHQFISLERRTSRNGKDIVTPPPGAADDLANSAAIALVAAAAEAAPALYRRNDVLVAGAPLPMPRRADAIFASAAIDQSGLSIFYWARGEHYANAAPLVLLDFDIRQRALDFAPVARRLQALAGEIRGAAPLGLFTSSQLAPYAGVVGLAAWTHGDEWLQHREALILAAAAELGRGRVKITTVAHEKSQNAPLPLFDLRPNAPSSASLDAALIGVAAVLPVELLPRSAA